MSAAELLSDLSRLGIQLEADGERLRYFPRSALTPDLLARLKAYKPDLLAMLRPAPDVMDDLRAAETRWIDESPDCDLATEPIAEPIGPDGWPVDCIDPNELTPCPNCGTLELWQSVAGDLFGLTPGQWRCMRCDPPTAARRLAEAAERFRRRAHRRTNTRHND